MTTRKPKRGRGKIIEVRPPPLPSKSIELPDTPVEEEDTELEKADTEPPVPFTFEPDVPAASDTNLTLAAEVEAPATKPEGELIEAPASKNTGHEPKRFVRAAMLRPVQAPATVPRPGSQPLNLPPESERIFLGLIDFRRF